MSFAAYVGQVTYVELPKVVTYDADEDSWSLKCAGQGIQEILTFDESMQTLKIDVPAGEGSKWVGVRQVLCILRDDKNSKLAGKPLETQVQITLVLLSEDSYVDAN